MRDVSVIVSVIEGERGNATDQFFNERHERMEVLFEREMELIAVLEVHGNWPR